MKLETMKAAMLGLAAGDALGVPVEFLTRTKLDQDPVTGMRSNGTHGQMAGTWSDDASMALCLLESLTRKGLDCADMMERFLRWANEGYMTARGQVFDMGISTRKALSRFLQGTPPLDCGGRGPYDNGNGSLMRILPLALYLHQTAGPEFPENPEAYHMIHQASAVTHAHPISLMACGFFCAAANELLRGRFEPEALQAGLEAARRFYAKSDGFAPYLEQFRRVDVPVLRALPREEVESGGFVLHTLEAALWCLLRTDSFAGCVLEAVNLGEDTDTTAAVAGGLAGIRYGLEAFPPDWLAVLAKRQEIEALCEAFWRKICS